VDAPVVDVATPPMRAFNQQSGFEDKPLFLAISGDASEEDSSTGNTAMSWVNDKQSRQFSPMKSDWYPYEETFEKLGHQYQISRKDAEELLPEFIFYWQERGDSSNVCNHKFITWVKQHLRFEQEREAKQLSHDRTDANQQHHQSNKDSVKRSLGDIHDFDW